MQYLRMPVFFVVAALFMVSVAAAQNPADDGLKAEITAVNIPADRRPVVTFKISDGKGKPLELGDLDADSVKFTIAVLKAGKSGDSDYQNYLLNKVAGKEYVYKGETRKPALAETLQPGFDQGGVLAKQRPGLFTYTFKTALPANFARSATAAGPTGTSANTLSGSRRSSFAARCAAWNAKASGTSSCWSRPNKSTRP